MSKKNKKSKTRKKFELRRSRLKSELRKKGLSEARREVLKRGIESVEVRLFIYTKEYGVLKRRKMGLVNKINGIKRVLRGSKGREMSVRERNSKLSEINEYNAELRKLNFAMKKGVYFDQKTGRVVFVSDTQSRTSTEVIPIWQVREIVEGLISTGRYDFIDVTNDRYSLAINKITALWALDDFIAEVTGSQYKNEVKTPMVEVTQDELNRIISVK